MFRLQSIRTKMIALGMAGVILTAASIVTIIAVQKKSVEADVDRELIALARNEVSKIAHDVHHMCRVSNDQLATQLDGTLNVIRERITSAGGIALAEEEVAWTAVNQYTNSAETVSLPRMTVGDSWLGQVTDAESVVPYIDDTAGLTGGTATVFQRMNERGDMLRIATNVMKTDGTRAIGTYIPAVNPDGSPNPVVSAVMRGETFRGRAYVVNAWTITVYEPVLDGEGRVIGMIYAGVPQESVASLRQSIMEIVVGKTGYVFVLGGTGDQKGDYIISAGGKRDGENIYGAKDANGTPFIQELIDKATATTGGGVDFQEYWWLNEAAGETEARKKISAVTYFEPWDWVIGAGAYEDDYKDAEANVAAALNGLMIWALIGAAVMLALCAIATWIAAIRITRPLISMVGTAEGLARGDVNQEIRIRSRDETGDLANAFRKMIAAQKAKADAVSRIAGGDLSAEVNAASEKDILGNAMVTLKRSIQTLVEDVNGLAESAVEGRLSTRADEERHEGEWRRIVNGVNRTLDAVIEPINDAAETLERLADYDLRARVTGEYKGDHARIKKSLNATAEALHDALAQVADASEQVSSASTQIASSSQQVAEGASEQASSLEETSSSLEEMASMTKQNADNTQQARGLTRQTREQAEHGSEAMESMQASMNQIRRAAEGTAEIIRDINEIAFQTNLLALNAAVEAARAGDAGRGFAVVAEEVRNLALRSKDAAARTEELIKESVSLAESGETKTNEVSGTLGEMVESISKVTDIVAEIAAASQEQAKGIEEVNRAVAEMDKVVQGAAANAEESSSAAQELASQSQELAAMVGRFRMNRQEAAAGSEPEETPAPEPECAGKEEERKEPVASGISLTPEDLIPLQDDPDFADF